MLPDRKLFVLFFLLLVSWGVGSAQSIKRLQKSIEKPDYGKAYDLVDKILEKDSGSIGGLYYLSYLQVHDKSRRDLEKARHAVRQAIEKYSLADEETKGDLNKVDLSMMELASLLRYITDQAYQEIQEDLSLETLNSFLEAYPEASQYSQAVFLRDSVAFHQAASVDSWQAYRDYMNAYPQSYFYSRARDRYQVLVFQSKTSDRSMESYMNFLEQHPESPFRREAEDFIFKKISVDHRADSYLDFLQRYPQTHLRKKIVDILYYLNKETSEWEEETLLKMHTDPDSLARMSLKEGQSVFPFLSGDSFGLMNVHGEEVLTPVLSLPAAQRCGVINSEWIMVDGKNASAIINRHGEVILSDVTSFNQLGSAVVAVIDRAGSMRLYHKSGFLISEMPMEQAEVLDGQWIIFKLEGLWGLMSMGGEVLAPANFVSIRKTGPFLIFEKTDKRVTVSSESLIRANSESGQIELEKEFSELEVMEEKYLIGMDEELETLLDEQLETLIPTDSHRIYINGDIWYTRQKSGYRLYDKTKGSLGATLFEVIETNEGWMALKNKGQWTVVPLMPDAAFPLRGLDSVHLLNKFAVVVTEKGRHSIFFQNGTRKKLQGQVQMLRSRVSDSPYQEEFIVVRDGGELEVLDQAGKSVIHGKHSGISFLTNDYFKFEESKKSGVISRGGDIILKAEYDGIEEEGGFFHLLKGGKFGGFDAVTRVLIPTRYESRIKKTDSLYQVSLSGMYGLVNTENDLVVPIEYEELIRWNDTSTWVRAKTSWRLMDHEGGVLMACEGLKMVGSSVDQLAIVYVKGRYSLLSPKSGFLLASEYDEVMNIGDEENPVFFCDQHLPKARFHVVSYIDAQGSLIWSQAYRPSEFALIQCDE